jgi:quercetin dioxygenase-like cupin family protein
MRAIILLDHIAIEQRRATGFYGYGGFAHERPSLTLLAQSQRAYDLAQESPDADDPDTGREVVMLTRRGFAGFASCALCGIAEFIATEASAQGAPPPATAGVTRKILSQTDGPAPGYVTLLVEATIEPGVPVARHTHPGIESAYVMEGALELPIQGQPTRTVKAGDGFQIPPETPHAGGKPGDAKTRVLITYIVEKGKPLASPA